MWQSGGHPAPAPAPAAGGCQKISNMSVAGVTDPDPRRRKIEQQLVRRAKLKETERLEWLATFGDDGLKSCSAKRGTHIAGTKFPASDFRVGNTYCNNCCDSATQRATSKAAEEARCTGTSSISTRCLVHLLLLVVHVVMRTPRPILKKPCHDQLICNWRGLMCARHRVIACTGPFVA